MPEPVADDFAQIARNLRHLQDQKQEAQDKANAEAAIEANMQRADEPVTPVSALTECTVCGGPITAVTRDGYHCDHGHVSKPAHNPLGFRDQDRRFDEEWVSIVEGLG